MYYTGKLVDERLILREVSGSSSVPQDSQNFAKDMAATFMEVTLPQKITSLVFSVIQ
jgi:hypothetical protein